MPDDDPARFPRPTRTEPRGEFPAHQDPPADRLAGPVSAADALSRVLALRAAWRDARYVD